MRRGCTGCFIPRSRSSRRCGPRVRPTPRARRISSGAASPAPSMRARRWSCCMTPRRCVNACRWACSTARRPPAWTLPFRWSSWNANSPHGRCRGATKALPGALMHAYRAHRGRAVCHAAAVRRSAAGAGRPVSARRRPSDRRTARAPTRHLFSKHLELPPPQFEAQHSRDADAD